MKAVILDLDGVLLNTEPVMTKACIKCFKESYGVTSQAQDYESLCGMGAADYFTALCKMYGVPFSDELVGKMFDTYLEIVSDEAEPFPGIPGKISGWHKNGILLAVASSSPSSKVYKNLEVSGIDMDCISAVVTGDDVTKAKPDPEIFRKAAEMLGVSPCDCTVYEDSVHGIEAARRCGMKAVGIRGTYDDEKLLEYGAEIILNSIAEA